MTRLPARPAALHGRELGPPQKAQSAKPLIEIARAKTRAEAMAALDIWRDLRSRAVALCCGPADVLVEPACAGREFDLVSGSRSNL